jgi:hypothetical protein
MAIERTPDNLEQNKNSFLMYLDHITVVNALSNEEAGMLLKALYHYASGNGNQDNLPSVVNVVFLMMQSQLKLDLKKWREKCIKNKENVGKRWNKDNTSVYERIPSDTKHTEYEYDKENEKVIKDNIEYSYEFEETWKIYPVNRREKKKDCYKYWEEIPEEKRIIFNSFKLCRKPFLSLIKLKD